MDAAVQTGLAWNEETNTETLLLELRERHPTQVAVAAFTKQEEALNGADWEWWIHDRGQWLGMRVQAKRTIKGKHSFYALRTYQAKSQPNPQVDNLINRAKRDGLIPIYCFYVSSLAPPWKAPNGCMIGRAEAVRAIPSSKYTDLAKIVVPWQRLVCPGQPKSESRRVHTAVAALSDSWPGGGPRVGTISATDTVPAYVRTLLRSGSSGSDEARKDVLAESDAAQRRVAGIVVIDAKS